MKKTRVLILAMITAFLAACSIPQGDLSEPPSLFTLVLPDVIDREEPTDDNGSVAYFSDNQKIGGVVVRYLSPESGDVIKIFYNITEDNQATQKSVPDFSILYPTGSTESDTATIQNACLSHSVKLDVNGKEQIHYYFLASNTYLYELWFDLEAISESDAEAAMQSFFFGYQRTDSPNGQKSISLAYFPKSKEASAYLWDIRSSQPILIDKISAAGMLDESAPSDPIWSPDGENAVITVSNDDLTTFTFLLSGQPAMFQAEQDNLMQPFIASGHTFDYSLSENPQASFIPIKWSDDGMSIQFSYTWTDNTGKTHHGTAYYKVSERTIYNVEE